MAGTNANQDWLNSQTQSNTSLLDEFWGSLNSDQLSQFGRALEEHYKKSAQYITDAEHQALSMREELIKHITSSIEAERKLIEEKERYDKLSLTEKRKYLEEQAKEQSKQLEDLQKLQVELLKLGDKYADKVKDVTKDIDKKRKELDKTHGRIRRDLNNASLADRLAEQSQNSNNSFLSSLGKILTANGQNGQGWLHNTLTSNQGVSSNTSPWMVALNEVTSILKGISGFGSDFLREYENFYNSYSAKVGSRLEGIGISTNPLDTYAGLVTKHLGANILVSNKRVMENLSRFVEAGIASDIDTRAFIATVAENIQTTFDAFDSNLVRLIRLQREDSTYARMGLEAGLTQVLNKAFGDTTYLSDMYDGVAGALIDASALMTKENAAEFEFVVQKWLGSLYSVGVSSSFVQQIASAVNMMATGNISGLANSPLQALMIQATNSSGYSGRSYAEMLQTGLTTGDTEKLLKGMVEYLATIADNTDNRIVSGQWNQYYGITMSDLQAVKNLTSKATIIPELYMTYDNMLNTTTDKLENMYQYFSADYMIDTAWENARFIAGKTIFNDPATYTLFKIKQYNEAIGNSGILGGVGSLASSGVGYSMDLITGGGDLLGWLGQKLDDLTGWDLFKDNAGPITTAGENMSRALMLLLRDEGRGDGFAETFGKYMRSYIHEQDGAFKLRMSKGIRSSIIDASTGLGRSISSESGISESGSYVTGTASTAEEAMKGSLQSQAKATNDIYETVEGLANAVEAAKQDATKVVLCGLEMGDSFEFPVHFGATGKTQLGTLIDANQSDLMNAAMLITEFIRSMTTEGGALNVNLYSSDVDTVDLVTGQRNSDTTPPPRGSGTSVVPSAINRMNNQVHMAY